MPEGCGHGITGYCTRCNDEKSARRADQWRQAAFAFELRAMRIEYVIRLLVLAGHVTQEKVDQALELARDFKRADSVPACVAARPAPPDDWSVARDCAVCGRMATPGGPCQRAAGVAMPWKPPPYPATPTEREALAKRRAALGVGGNDGR